LNGPFDDKGKTRNGETQFEMPFVAKLEICVKFNIYFLSINTQRNVLLIGYYFFYLLVVSYNKKIHVTY